MRLCKSLLIGAVVLFSFPGPVIAAPPEKSAADADGALNGAAPGESFGNSLALAGDVNGDAIEDFLIGAPLANGGGTPGGSEPCAARGKVYVISGRDLSNLYVISGESASPEGCLGSGDHFGNAVAGAGDVDGDGYGDFIIGAKYYDNLAVTPPEIDVGAAYVFSGNPALIAPDGTPKLLHKFVGKCGPKFGSDGDNFGQSVAGIGDLDGDGKGELLVGAPKSDNCLAEDCNCDLSTNQGAAWVFSGLSGAPLYKFVGKHPDARFGSRVAEAGDIDQDGTPDFMVSSPRLKVPKSPTPADPFTGQMRGGVYLFSGRDGNGDGKSDLLHLFAGEASYDQLGRGEIRVVGDFGAPQSAGCDGLPDFALGADQVKQGISFIYSGPPNYELIREIAGEEAFDHFGHSVAPLGDIDDDGCVDLIIGGPTHDLYPFVPPTPTTPGMNPHDDSGSAYLYSWHTSAPTKIFSGEIALPPYDHFGWSVLGIDGNRDGSRDVVIGAPGDSAPGSTPDTLQYYSGRVYFFANPPPKLGVDIGFGLPDQSSTLPSLSASGSLKPGKIATLWLSGSTPNAKCELRISLEPVTHLALGHGFGASGFVPPGGLLSDTPLATFSYATDGAGKLSVEFDNAEVDLTAVLSKARAVYFQFVIYDSATGRIDGISNALKVVVES